MSIFQRSNKTALIIGSLACSFATAEDPYAVIGGGNDGGAPYVSLVNSTGVLTPIDTGLATGQINGVAMNANGYGIVGGTGPGTAAYAAFFDPSGGLTPLTLGIADGYISRVDINNSQKGILGGQNTGTSAAYAALVDSNGTLTPLAIGIIDGSIRSVGINENGAGIIGGVDSLTGAAYAALVSPLGGLTPLATGLDLGIINYVGITDSGQGIIGGQNFTSGAAYAALVAPAGALTPLATGIATGAINRVAINTSGQGIIGGVNGTALYAALVAPSGALTPLATGVATGAIQSVAINDSGYGIIGGQDGGNMLAYGALFSPSGDLIPLSIGGGNGTIFSAAINNNGQGVIGGRYFGGNAFAALVDSDGTLIPLATGIAIGAIYGVDILPLLSNIPMPSLSGNNLIFADYINQYASVNAFYFVPAVLDGTLSQALESAAPTRNAFSFYTANNNLFYLTTGLSTHIRARRAKVISSKSRSVALADLNEDDLTASLRMSRAKKAEPPCAKESNQPYTFWVEALGAVAYQKPQSQTPGFSPASGGGIFAFEAQVTKNTVVGTGATYLYTHIHEKNHAGHSNINQEDLFLYASWDNRQWYFDGSVLGGLFQTKQVRNITMTGFEFKSTSKPNGWQLVPHVELGYNHSRPKCVRSFEWRLNPFVMVDWANSWQDRFKEKGSGPFNAGQKSHHGSLLRTEAGLRFYESFLFDNWTFSLAEKIGYVNTQNYGSGKVNAFLVGFPGSFTVETLQSAQNLGVGQFSMIFTPAKGCLPTTSLSYQGEYGSKYQSHQGMLELAWVF